MNSPDPFPRGKWYAWAILIVLAIAIPFACTVSQASPAPTETQPETRADGPAEPEDVSCLNGWCIVKQDTLVKIINSLDALAKHTRDLRTLCGWKESPG